MKTVMISVLRKKVQKGMKLTASTKFCHTNSGWATRSGARRAISSLDLRAVTTIQ